MAFRNRRKTSLFLGFESETISTKGGPGGVLSVQAKLGGRTNAPPPNPPFVKGGTKTVPRSKLRPRRVRPIQLRPALDQDRNMSKPKGIETAAVEVS